MVLGHRLILPLAGLTAACSAAPPPAAKADTAADGGTAQPVLDTLRLGATDLALVARDGGCTLRRDGRDHALGIPAPCRFLHRNRSPQPTVEDYGDRGRVTMVIGPPAPAADYPRGAAETPQDRCASEGRPILERDGRLALGEVMRSPAGYCPDIGLDEKFYYGIAHAAPFASRTMLD